MTIRTPERKITAGPRCDRPIQGDGIMSYHCSLPQGHDQENPSDPEPCFAVESARSARAWDAWSRRQDRKQEPEPQRYITCPACGQQSMQIHSETGDGLCGSCGETAEVQPDLAMAETEGYAQGKVLAQEAIAEDQDSAAEPTKQRPGDQRLPDGGQVCVQDLVIAAMEESKRVGTERYGQPLMTFNGRKGIQDIAEEIRDLFVYFTQVQEEAKADRETLIEVVTQAMSQAETEGPRWFESADHKDYAEIAVDRIMGWVVGQKMGRA